VQRIFDLFLRNYNSSSVAFTLVGFLLSLSRDPHALLQAHLGRAIAAGAIPSALVLIFGAFAPESLAKVRGLGVAIAFGGITLLYVSLTAALR